MDLEYTDPHLYLFDPITLKLYVMDDYGYPVQIKASLWYA